MTTVLSHTQAIRTRWKCPTNTQGSRIVVSCRAKRMTVGWDYALNIEDNHRAAAQRLLERLGWDGMWVGGVTGSGEMCFVRTD